MQRYTAAERNPNAKCAEVQIGATSAVPAFACIQVASIQHVLHLPPVAIITIED